MTVIAWDGVNLAADSQCTSDNIVSYLNKMWMYDFGDSNAVLAGFGDIGDMHTLCEWYAEGAKPQKYFELFPNCGANLLVWTDDGLVEYEQSPYPINVISDKYAWGSGAHMAMGALNAGATALGAVKAASMSHNECGGDILLASLDDIQRIKQC